MPLGNHNYQVNCVDAANNSATSGLLDFSITAKTTSKGGGGGGGGGGSKASGNAYVPAPTTTNENTKGQGTVTEQVSQQQGPNVAAANEQPKSDLTETPSVPTQPIALEPSEFSIPQAGSSVARIVITIAGMIAGVLLVAYYKANRSEPQITNEREQ